LFEKTPKKKKQQQTKNNKQQKNEWIMCMGSNLFLSFGILNDDE
jgi:hypothetical protein